MSQQEIIQLLDRYLAGTATIPEQERVEQWLNSNEDLNNDWEAMDETQRTDFLATLSQRIQQSIHQKPVKIIPFYRRNIFRWIAAASIILILGISAYVILSGVEGRHKTTEVAKTNDIEAPKDSRAVITLADGSKVYLDSASNGTIAQQNNAAIVKNGKGEVVYQSLATTNSLIAYNTLFNPRGSKVISLILSDGTKVWLNSESSLKYPTAFNSNTREVEIAGEAYFEVKHNSAQPFKVHLPNGSIVEDLGTEFNINAYADEAEVKTTLVQGSLRVMLSGVEASTRGNSVTITPGQQVIVHPSTPLRVTNNVDIEEVTAWKNGSFSFNRTNIVSIMKQVERWYDVQVEFKDDVRANDFTGGIARTENVSQVLKMLEKTGVVHFKVEGKKIIVSK